MAFSDLGRAVICLFQDHRVGKGGTAEGHQVHKEKVSVQQRKHAVEMGVGRAKGDLLLPSVNKPWLSKGVSCVFPRRPARSAAFRVRSKRSVDTSRGGEWVRAKSTGNVVAGP